MKSSDVAVYGVTAQPQEEADKAVTQLRLHYKTYGDPDHKLATHLKDKGLLDVIIARQGDSRHPKVKDYKDGMAQPGTLLYILNFYFIIFCIFLCTISCCRCQS